MFHKVQQLTIDDSIHFEPKLFTLISQDFPFLEYLYISNAHPQKDKQHSSTLVQFSYLTFLDLKCPHDDYAELFLLEKNAHLPHLLNLRMEYELLKTITNNFNIDATYFNLGTLKGLDICLLFVCPENIHQYFPFL
jgi:hypothetical protein